MPQANLAAVAGQRPSLLLGEEWAGLPAAVGALRGRYSEGELSSMVAVEPLLLVEDLEGVLAELGRWVVLHPRVCGWCCTHVCVCLYVSAAGGSLEGVLVELGRWVGVAPTCLCVCACVCVRAQPWR